jgi:YD repeat-containing protein
MKGRIAPSCALFLQYSSSPSPTYEPTFSRITSITDPLNHTTTAAYNDGINQISITDPLGNEWKQFRGPWDRATWFKVHQKSWLLIIAH